MEYLNNRDYEPSRGKIEATLARLWQSLLKIERVDRHDNFFELGGHSVLIVQLMERLRQIGLAVEARQVFDNPTVAGLAGVLGSGKVREFVVPPNLIPPGCQSIIPQMLPLVQLETEHIEQIVRAVPGGAVNIKDIYPLTPLQECVFSSHLRGQPANADIRATLVSLTSRATLDIFIQALQSVIDRHDVLRTAVLWEQLPQPVQVVYRQAVLPVREIAFDQNQGLPEQLRLWLQSKLLLDLRHAPLMALHFASGLKSDQYHAVLLTHALVCDDQSIEIVLSEVMAHLQGCIQELPETIDYRSHVAETLAYTSTRDAEELFFRSKLHDVEEPTTPFGLLDERRDGSESEEAYQPVEIDLARRIRAQARRLGVTAATLFHAGWALVVAHISARDDVVFGSVLLGRIQGSTGTRRILGMFNNTLPLRIPLKQLTATQLIEQTQRELVELLSHEQSSLALAQRCSGVADSTPLFSTVLNYRHSPPDREAQWSSETGVTLLDVRGSIHYPITISVSDLGEGFTITAQTDRRIDPQRMGQYLCTAMQSLVEALRQAPQAPAMSLSILPESERRQILELFNATETNYPKDRTLPELFEQQVQRTPAATAVVYEGQSFTYAEINAKANQLARVLMGYGVAVGEYIPIVMMRSPQMLIAQLAALKCGAVYVPLDPELPSERRAFIIRDCDARRIITNDNRSSGLRLSEKEQWIDLSEITGLVERSPVTNPDISKIPTSAAYLMYTSGSTGTPKGVIVPHRAVGRLVINNVYAQIEPTDCVAHYSNSMFDASTFEVWGALLNGASLVIVPQSVVLNAETFSEVLQRQRVTVLWMSVGLFNQYTDSLAGVFSKLRYLLVGGDALEPMAVRRVLETSPPLCFLNGYGPTECTTFSTTYPISIGRKEAKSIPIGRPISNSTCYILDQNQQPVAMGVTGEIHIGGDGVAQGYLNRPELTAERFTADPFNTQIGTRMYRTGDLGCWRPNGDIEFLGRKDRQVKVRGFRIELGEIEAQLLLHPKIKEAVVLAREDEPGEKRLVAYLVSRESSVDNSVSLESLRAHLRRILPEYMVPSAFVMLETMPLTPNGKLDRRALPAPEQGAYVSREYEAPLGELEEILAEIWRSLLRLKRVGRRDNFFELGGHSLFIVQMRERLRRLGLSAEARHAFECPTLADLARVIFRVGVEPVEVPPNQIPPGSEVITPQMLPLIQLEAEHIERIVAMVPGGAANIQDIYPLAPLQEGILFHHLLNKNHGDPYVLPMLLSFSSEEKLTEFMSALQSVVDRHDVLRTAVLWEQLPRPVQVVYRQARIQIAELTPASNSMPIEQISEHMRLDRQKMELSLAPLIRVVTRRGNSGQWLALLQLHHLTCDKESLDVLFDEALAYAEGRASELPSAMPYRDHVAQVLADANTLNAKAFFREKLGDITEPTAPFQLLNVRGDGSQLADAHLTLDPTLTDRVRRQARVLGVSVATVFHAAWALVVSRTSGRDTIVYGTVLLGRFRGRAGAQRVLGAFVNTLPLRLRLSDASVKDLVLQTQRELAELLTHEQASLAVAQRCSGITGSAPLFSSILNYRTRSYEAGPGRSGVHIISDSGWTNYPIAMSIDDRDDGIVFSAQTDSRVAPLRVLGYFNTAVEQLVKSLEETAQGLLSALPILPLHERQYLIRDLNATGVVDSDKKMVHELFEDRVRESPDAIAAICETRQLSYIELNKKSNSLARYLRARGLTVGEYVPVVMSRSLDLLVAQLAILKAGGAFVPIDSDAPTERKAFMVEDCGARWLIADRPFEVSLHVDPRRWVHIAADTDSEKFPTDDLDLSLSVFQPAYVMYTSGSTGTPKGVVVSHRAISGLVVDTNYIHLSRDDRVVNCNNPAFDGSTFDVWGALLNGARLLIVPRATLLDADDFAESLARHHASVILLTTALFNQYATTSPEIFSGFRSVFFGGEAADPNAARNVLEKAKLERLANVYGPTEATTFATWYVIDTVSADLKSVPIGRPIGNRQIYIVDPNMQPVPVGVTGQILIGGQGVALGYLGRPDLTAQRFVADPFGADPNGRLYQTGDVGLWREDGTIEYVGRNDQQVKLRGLRIELGEIEGQLLRDSRIRETAVVVREDIPGEKYLAAYLTVTLSASHQADSVISDELRVRLKAALPEYMIPVAFVILSKMPLTPNGKIDRRALPVPDRDDINAAAGGHGTPPEGEFEIGLAEIWQDLLRVERVVRESSFVELGGHSLLSMKLLVRIVERFKIHLSLTSIVQETTLRAMALLIQERVREGIETLAPQELELEDSEL